ncbi:MAG: hypothetical protein R3Y57_04010 [Erysipelotrichaceae bacterium]
MRKTKNIIKGLMFILFAVLLIASDQQWFGEINVFRWLIVIFFGYLTLSYLLKRKFITMGLCAPITYYFIQPLLFLPELSIWLLLAVSMLISIGLSMIFDHPSHIEFTYDSSKNKDYRKNDYIIDEEEVVYEDGSKQKRIFEAATTYLYTDDFDEKYLKCKASALEVYFRQGSNDKQSVTLNLEAMMSAVEINVPRNWYVVLDMDSEASVMENNYQEAQTNFTLFVKGRTKFSAIEVNYI